MKPSPFKTFLKIYGTVCTIGGLLFMLYWGLALDANSITEVDCLFREFGSVLIALSGVTVLRILDD